MESILEVVEYFLAECEDLCFIELTNEGGEMKISTIALDNLMVRSPENPEDVMDALLTLSKEQLEY